MSLPRYAEYKNSGVAWLGEVPAHWNLRRLGYFFDERREKVSDADFAPLSVTRAGIVPQLENVAKTDDGGNRKKVCAGDFVINGRSDRKGSSGASAMDGSCSLISIVLCPNDGIRIDFAHHLMRSVPFQEEFYRYGKGIVADLWSTNYSEMKNISLAVPPSDEQSSIATFLDRETGKIDALIAEQEKLLTLLAEKRQATISHAVTRGLTYLPGADLTAAFGGGPTGEGKDSPSSPNAPMKDSGVPWLGEVPAHWKVLALRRLIDRFEQGWSPECEARPADPGEWGVLKAGCVNGGEFDAQENKALPISLVPREELELKSGDVLMSRASGSPKLIGSVACVMNPPSHLMLSDKIFRIRLSADVDPRFFAAAMGSTPLRQQIEQAIGGAEGLANNLPQASIKEFWMSLPPVEEQLAIIEFLACERAKLDDLAGAAEHAVALLKERRSALIAAAVTGKVDVRHSA